MVRVHSACDSRVLTHISEREARLMCGEDTYGNSLEGVEPTARRLSRKKEPLRDIRLMHPVKEERNSPCTLTKSDMLLNADGAVNPEIRRKGQQGRIGGAVDQAMTKVEMWPEVHDDRAPVISAGKVFGATYASL
jgi:hypothetical protein